MKHFDRLRALYRDELDSQTVARRQVDSLIERVGASAANRKLIVFRSALSESIQQVMDAPSFDRLRQSMGDDLSMRRLTTTPAFLRLAALWATAADPESGASTMKRLFDDAQRELGALPATREALAQVIARAKAHRGGDASDPGSR